MNCPKPHMRTSTGTLLSPPYPHPRPPSSLKPAHSASFITTQQHPHGPDGTEISAYVIEWAIAKLLRQMLPHRGDCERARRRGKSVWRHEVMGKGIVDVFFNIKGDHNGITTKNTAKEVLELQQIHLQPGAVYVALSSTYTRLLVHFSHGLSMVYGPTLGPWVHDSTTYNLEEYASIHPPSLPPSPPSHTHKLESWLLSNPHHSYAPWSRAGVYHWGFRPALDLEYTPLDTCIAQDTYDLPASILPVHAQLLKSLGNITRAASVLLGAVDPAYKRMCKRMISAVPETRRGRWATDEKECFSLRVCSLNVPVDPVFDGGDIKSGWAVVVPMGEFSGGDLCFPTLGRRVLGGPGSVTVVRHGVVEWWASEAKGTRYCLVSSTQETLKGEYFDGLLERR